MSEAVSIASDAASNEIAVAAGKVFGNIIIIALFVAPIVLLYFIIVNFRKLLVEIREKREAEEAAARAVEERKRQLSEMESEESGEEFSEEANPEEDNSGENQGE